MGAKEMIHLWHHFGRNHIRSECGLRPRAISSKNLTGVIVEAECKKCLILLREQATWTKRECINRLNELPEPEVDGTVRFGGDPDDNSGDYGE